MSNLSWPKRLYLLDVSRGVASLGVVLFHWVHFSWSEGVLGMRHSGFTLSDQPFYPVLKLFYEYGDLGVNYFFILSGFIFFWLYQDKIYSKGIGFLHFWIQRFSRLYPLHLATLLLVGLLQFFFLRETGYFFIYPANNAYHFLLNLGFMHGLGLEKGWSFNHPTWSVSVEIFLYLVFFISAFKIRSRISFCTCVSVLSFVLSLYFSNKVFLGLALFFWGGTLFHVSGYFVSGYRRIKVVVGVVSLLSWVLVMTHCYLVDLTAFFDSLGTAGVILLAAFKNYCLLGATILFFALSEISKGALLKRLSWVGDITYSTYLLHFPLNVIFGALVVANVLDPLFFLNPVYLVIYMVVLIPVSYICYRCFERPTQEYIRKTYNRMVS